MESSVKPNEVVWQTSSPTQINVLLIAEDTLVRVGLRQLLSRAAEVVVVGEAGTGHALDMAHHFLPDIALVDAHRVNGTLASFVQHLTSISAKTRAIVLSDADFTSGVVQTAEAGAWGYLPRDLSEAELVRAVRLVAQGRAVMACWLAPGQFVKLGELSPHHSELALPLSEKESTVIKAVAQGQTDGQIAQELGISVPTIKTHVRSILRKTNSRNRAAAIATAFRSGVLK